MITNPLKRLRGLTTVNASASLVWAVSLALAVCFGALLILFGWFLEVLARVSYDYRTADGTQLGQYIHLNDSLLGNNISPLGACTELLVLMFAMVLAISLLFFFVSRLAGFVSMESSLAQVRAIHAQLQLLARRRSPTLMQPLVQELIAVDVPLIRDATLNWLRYGPSCLCITLVCIGVSAAIEPLLTVLSLLAILLAQQISYGFDRNRRRGRPVLLEQRNAMLQRLASWLSNNPTYAALNRDEVSQSKLEHEFSNFRMHYLALDNHLIWKSPVTLFCACIFGLLILFAGAVRVVRPDTTLTVIAGLMLFVTMLSAIFAFVRFGRVRMGLQSVVPNINHMVDFLTQAAPKIAVDSSIQLPEHVQSVELHGVTLRSHNDEVALDSVTANFHAGEIVAIASDNATAQSALSDLLLGFGYPTGGECFIQGIPLSKLGVDRMGDLACWVAHDGPLFTASVDENLRTVHSPQVKAVDLPKVLHTAKCETAINALQDGLATLISPGDDRLSGDIPFRLGVARALTLRKPIVVVQEPPANDDAQMETETRETIEQLAANNFIVIVIPSRSKTLWSAHQVLFLQNGRLVAAGKHANLLEQNDAYRHWNYMRFSPYLARAMRY